MKGVGKTSSARILAKALNCEKGPAIEPCNQCQTCLEITEDNSTDYMEIDGASNNGVNEVRSLRETVKYKPLKNRYRIVVIDEVHMLSNAAWNALLKTVEEPPEHTIFIMATTDFHKIPATIVSRCQHFEFKRIPFEVIKQVLKDICQKEDDHHLRLRALPDLASAEGSLRDAKKILDQAIAISNGDVKDDDVVAILGIIDEETFITLTRDVFTQDRKGIIEQINQLIERGTDLRFFYTEYLRFIRDVIVIKSIPDSERLHNLNPENVAVITRDRQGRQRSRTAALLQRREGAGTDHPQHRAPLHHFGIHVPEAELFLGPGPHRGVSEAHPRHAAQRCARRCRRARAPGRGRSPAAEAAAPNAAAEPTGWPSSRRASTRKSRAWHRCWAPRTWSCAAARCSSKSPPTWRTPGK